ncbi:DUF5906 domain-containing protein [Rhodospirillales bacterium]|nr:DUF5906 domain-containing protein [Rhodospirillales bacterium]
MKAITYREAAPELLKMGYSPIPILPGSKKCVKPGWNGHIDPDPGQVEEWCGTDPDCGIGLVCGHVAGIDIDVYDPKIAEACANRVVELSDGEPLLRFGRRPKRLFLFQVIGGNFSKLVTPEFTIGEVDNNKVEILAKGQMFVAFAVHPETKQPYDWPERSPLEIRRSDLPAIREEGAQMIRDDLARLIEDMGGVRKNRNANTRQTVGDQKKRVLSDQDWEELEEALSYIDPEPRDNWIAVGHALKIELGDAGLDPYQTWSRTRPDGTTPANYQGEKDVAKTWSSFKPKRTSLNVIWQLSAAAGYSRPEPGGTENNEDILSMIEDLNQEWFVVVESGKVFVCRQRVDLGTRHEYLEYCTPEEFHKIFANKTCLRNGKYQKTSRVWFEHARRREYPFGTVCDPTEKAGNGYFNTWRGFAISVADEDPSPLIEHIEQTIASGDLDLAEYTKGWLAQAVQKPGILAGTVLVLRGRQGTGKGVLATAMLNIFGKHSQHISQSEHLVGRFQSHLEDCLFLFADEAFFPGDPKIKGQLKSLVTERLLTIEAKYRPPKMVRNHLSILMASNEDFVVPAEIDDRRFVVLDVSDSHRNDETYFSTLWDVVDGPRLSGFLKYLLQYDLSDFDIRQIPETAARSEQKTFMFNSGMKFIFWALQRGSFYANYETEEFNDHSDWHEFRSTQLLYALYERWYRMERYKSKKLGLAEVGKLFAKFAEHSRPSGNQVISINGEKGERPHGYAFGDLDSARFNFEGAFDVPHIDWSDQYLVPIEEEVPF